jgi:ATP-binding cassette subfamily F protein 3
MPQATILTATNLARSFGPDEIFRDVSFQINDREHVALVGVNGAGKSTLLRIAAGLDAPSRGELAIASGARVAYLAQEPRFDSDRSVGEEARLAFAEALTALERMRTLEAAMQSADGTELDALFHEYERLSIHFEVAGGYDVEHRTAEVLSGLGFTADQTDESVRTLSGGQKTRLALAKTLLAEPDLLLLDEPTNHLDLDMLSWLEAFLTAWNGAFLVVSHDRYFLDRVTKRTLDLSFGRLEDYPAPYSRYLRLREERMARRWQEYEDQQEQIARTEEFIRRYKAGQRAREARGRQTRLDRLERIERPQEHSSLKLMATPVIRSGREVISATPLQIGYRNGGETRQLVSTPELRVERGDRIGIIGGNGTGKSTLLKTIVGELPPLRGHVSFGTNVTIGYYAQGHEGLPLSGSPLSILLDAHPMSEEAARTYFARFLFRGDEVLRPIDALSGGERSRLALACLLVRGANLLILDEPTNHLDIQSRETLEEMLGAYEGTAMFVSHDRFFIDRVATRVWEIADYNLVQYLGNFSAAAAQKTRQAGPETTTVAPAIERRQEPALSRSESRRAESESEPRLQKRLQSVEREIARLEGLLNELSDAIAIASIDSDRARLEHLGTEYAAAEGELDQAYALWEDVNQKLASLAAAAAV